MGVGHHRRQGQPGGVQLLVRDTLPLHLHRLGALSGGIQQHNRIHLLRIAEAVSPDKVLVKILYSCARKVTSCQAGVADLHTFDAF